MGMYVTLQEITEIQWLFAHAVFNSSQVKIWGLRNLERFYSNVFMHIFNLIWVEMAKKKNLHLNNAQ